MPKAGTVVLLIFCGGPSSKEEWRLRTPPVREGEGLSSSFDSSDSFSLRMHHHNLIILWRNLFEEIILHLLCNPFLSCSDTVFSKTTITYGNCTVSTGTGNKYR
jgi:hypothetical protein